MTMMAHFIAIDVVTRTRSLRCGPPGMPLLPSQAIGSFAAVNWYFWAPKDDCAT
jgi:hypothetical protein